MSKELSKRYFYRCFSKRSAAALKSGQNGVCHRLAKSELFDQFELHRIWENKQPTTLVSVSDRPIEALYRAFVKYYNFREKPRDIWIVMISVPTGEIDTLPYHHAKGLALELGMSPEESRKFKHEYVFEWEIPGQYVEHIVSVETLLDRGLNLDSYLKDDRLPALSEFRRSMVNMILSKPLDGYCVGQELGRMARSFGARAPVEEIAHGILTDCPLWISVDRKSQYVEWAIGHDSDIDEYHVESIGFEHFYWISQGIHEVLYDSWLADGVFIEDRIAHSRLAKGLTAEMKIQWELYHDNLSYEVWAGLDPDSAADDARELRVREHETFDLIERHAVLIGL
jgi:hypothetical protein